MFRNAGESPGIGRVEEDEMALTDDARVFRAGERAFETLRERGIPPSPENYLVWYTHFADENPALSRMIRLLEQNRDGFGPERCRELYARYFPRGDAHEAIREATERVRTLTENLGRELDRSREETARASVSIETIGSELGGRPDTDELRRLVTALEVEARRMAAQTRSLGRELHRSSREIAELRSHLQRVEREATTDPLTGLANRRQFDFVLRRLATASVEHGRPLALLVVDIDRFKQFNDAHGHDVGDVVLRLVARQIRDAVRQDDLPARYGGEEFAVLMPGADLRAPAAVAERLRASVASRRLRSRDDGRDLGTVTLSVGAAQYRPGEPLDVFFRRADAALYTAKRSGRNRVVREDHVDAIAAVSDVPAGAPGAA